jgi:hypothetical protein
MAIAIIAVGADHPREKQPQGLLLEQLLNYYYRNPELKFLRMYLQQVLLKLHFFQ